MCFILILHLQQLLAVEHKTLVKDTSLLCAIKGYVLLDTKNLNSQKISLGSRSFHPTPDLFSEKEWHQNDHEMLHGT